MSGRARQVVKQDAPSGAVTDAVYTRRCDLATTPVFRALVATFSAPFDPIRLWGPRHGRWIQGWRDSQEGTSRRGRARDGREPAARQLGRCDVEDDDTIWLGIVDFAGALRSSDVEPGLYQVSAAGGVPQLVTSPDASDGVLGYLYPHALPDGGAILYSAYRADYGSSVAVYVPETGEHRPLAEGRLPWFAASGHVMFSDHETDRTAGTGGGGTLWLSRSTWTDCGPLESQFVCERACT